MVDACETSLRGGGKLMFCGNGGSAADSQHLATEMLIRLRGSVERPSSPALALTLDPAVLTAGGNDYGYEQRVRTAVARAGPRRRRAVRHHDVGPIAERDAGAAGGAGDGDRHRRPARRRRASRRSDCCDHVLLVPDKETARIQECHIALGHAVLELLEDRLVARPL